MREVHDDAFEVVHPERARGARRVLGVRGPGRDGLRIEHRVVDDELRTPVEELLEGLGAVGAVEDVRLRHAFPWKVAALRAQLIAQAIELLLLRQQHLALCDPLLVRDDPMIRDGAHRSDLLRSCWSRAERLARRVTLETSAVRPPVVVALAATIAAPVARQMGHMATGAASFPGRGKPAIRRALPCRSPGRA